MKPTYRKSNLLLWSVLTFGLSFKVKQWFTDFGELSFRWIQFCIDSPMRRSSYYILSSYLCTIYLLSRLLGALICFHVGLIDRRC